MQSSSQLRGLPLSRRLEQAVYTGSYPVMCSLYILGGFVSALARIMGETAPFGIAYIAAVPVGFSLPSALGVAIGYAFLGNLADSYRFIAACFLLAIIKWLLGEEKWNAHPKIFVPVSAVLAVIAAGVVPALYSDPLIYDIIMWITQVIIAGAASAFLFRAIKTFSSTEPYSIQNTAISVAFVVAVMGLQSLQVSEFTFGRTLAVVAILISAKVGGTSLSVVTGTLAGFAVAFAGGNFTLYMTIFSLGGLLAGEFAVFGKIGSALALCATHGFITLISATNGSGFVEVIVGAVIFLMMPSSWFKVMISAGTKPDSTVATLASEKLYEVAAAMQEVTEKTQEVADRLDKIYSNNITAVYDKTAERICKHCIYNTSCWNQQYNDTVDAISFALRKCKMRGTLSDTDFPEKFMHCVRRQDMASFLTTEYKRSVFRETEKRNTGRIRSILAEQMSGMTLAMKDVSGAVNDLYTCDSMMAAKAEELFTERRLEPIQVVCRKNRAGKLSVLADIPYYKENRITPELLCEELNEILLCEVNMPTVKKIGSYCRLIFNEKTEFEVEYGAFQVNSDDSSICGDSYRVFDCDGTEFNALISDGMGTGSSAAVDSAMATSLLTKLLQAGVGYKAAIKILNGALVVKSENESMATVDGLQVDLYTGDMKIFKAGAAPTLVIRGGNSIQIEASSLPAGILDKAQVSENKLKLSVGDLIIMMSDGVAFDGVDWVPTIVENCKDVQLVDIAKQVVKAAQLRRTDGKSDDITVVCCRMVKNNKKLA